MFESLGANTNWQIQSLSDFMEIKGDSWIDIEDNVDYQILGVTGKGSGLVIKRKVSGAELKMRQYQVARLNQLMWCKVDTTNGAFGITKSNHVGALSSPNMCLADIDTNKCLPEFLQLFFRLPTVYEGITTASLGTTNRQYLKPQELLNKVRFHLPSIEEQRRIVAHIESLAARVNEAQSLREEADALTKIYEAVITKSVFQVSIKNNGDSSLPNLPHNWMWKRIGDFAFVTKLAGYEFTKHVEYSEFGDVPVIRAQNVSKTGFKEGNYLYVKKDLVEFLQRSRLQGGEVLIVFVGAGIGNVGIAPKDKEFFLGPNVALIRVDENVIINQYLYMFLKSEVGKSHSRGFSKVTAQGSISMANIRDIKVPIPPLEEQHQIVSFLNVAHKRLEELGRLQEETQKELKAILPSILDKAFKGEL